MTGGNNRNAPPLAERLWARTVRTAAGCLEWQGAHDGKGYGQISEAHGRKIRTHRAAWQLTHGPIPEGMWVLHRRDNPPCCDPTHLFLGSAADNTADMVAKGRASGPSPWSNCSRGHRLPPCDRRKNRRSCDVCRRERDAANGRISKQGRKVDRPRCPQGHPYSVENTYIATWPDGAFRSRMCRACSRDRARRRREAREAAS